jgi:hypothetical protein
MPDLPRDAYIKDQITRNRINRQPKPSGQMELPGIANDAPLPLVPGTTKHSPEQMEVNRRGMAMVRGIFESRRNAFTAGQTPAPYIEHHDGEPPCIGC